MPTDGRTQLQGSRAGNMPVTLMGRVPSCRLSGASGAGGWSRTGSHQQAPASVCSGSSPQPPGHLCTNHTVRPSGRVWVMKCRQGSRWEVCVIGRTLAACQRRQFKAWDCPSHLVKRRSMWEKVHVGSCLWARPLRGQAACYQDVEML